MKHILLVLLIMIYWVNIKAQDYTGYTGCCEQDSMALVAFYNATDGANWYSNQEGFSIDDLGDDVLEYYQSTYPNAGMNPWFDGPVKDWFGVTLEKQLAENGTDSIWRVIHLHPTVDRRSNGDDNLSGYVPREVGMLTALQWFKVNGNTGLSKTKLPDEIYQPDMEEFDVEAAYFSGIVSEEIRNCTKLQFLNLRYNYFDSIPVVDFVDKDVFNEWFTQSGKVFFYNNQISWETLEPTVEYFVKNGGVYEARQQHDVGRYQEIVVSEGDDVTLSCSDAGSDEYATYNWYKDGVDTGISGSTYSISGVTDSETGNYTVKVANSYVQDNDANSDYGDEGTFTKKIHLTFTPSSTKCYTATSSQDGKSIELNFSKPMAVPSDSQKSEFTVTSGGETKTIESINRTGRLFKGISLNLEGALKKGEEVTVSYTQGSVTSSTGGELAAFSKSVENRTSVQPNFVSAETRTDGMGIILSFDYFIDPDDDKLDASAFSIGGSSGNSITSVSLVDGDVDSDISKKVLLVVSNALNTTDEITVSYKDEAVFGLYGAPVEAKSGIAVTNNVEANRVSVTFSVIDGTEELDDISIYGDLSTDFISLYDDGTSGDETADDHIWSRKLSLAGGDFSWDVYNNDTILSEDMNLSVSVTDGVVSGDTTFGYKNNTLTLILDLENFLTNEDTVTADPYVMGIDDDWTEGLAMDTTSNQYQYSLSINLLSYNEIVKCSFRNGDFWENTNLLTRNITITEDTTITCEFGGDIYERGDDESGSSIMENIILSNADENEEVSIAVFPNPVTNTLNVTGIEDNMTVCIYDLTGTLKLTYSGESNTIDVSALAKGMYIVKLYEENQAVYITQIIKY